MVTTAQGIETQQQLDQLRALDCTRGQGYYFLRLWMRKPRAHSRDRCKFG